MGSNHVLQLEPGDPLGTAFVALWTRMLCDPALLSSDHRSLSFDIQIARRKRTNPAPARRASRRAARQAGLVKYFVRGDAFDFAAWRATCVQLPPDPPLPRGYQLLKDAAVTVGPAPVRRLRRASTVRIEASTAYGDSSFASVSRASGRCPKRIRDAEGNDPPGANPLRTSWAVSSRIRRVACASSRSRTSSLLKHRVKARQRNVLRKR